MFKQQQQKGLWRIKRNFYYIENPTPHMPRSVAVYDQRGKKNDVKCANIPRVFCRAYMFINILNDTQKKFGFFM